MGHSSDIIISHQVLWVQGNTAEAVFKTFIAFPTKATWNWYFKFFEETREAGCISSFIIELIFFPPTSISSLKKQTRLGWGKSIRQQSVLGLGQTWIHEVHRLTSQTLCEAHSQPHHHSSRPMPLPQAEAPRTRAGELQRQFQSASLCGIQLQALSLGRSPPWRTLATKEAA